MMRSPAEDLDLCSGAAMPKLASQPVGRAHAGAENTLEQLFHVDSWFGMRQLGKREEEYRISFDSMSIGELWRNDSRVGVPAELKQNATTSEGDFRKQKRERKFIF